MSIVYSGDYITFPDNTTLSTGTVGAKNRIINGDMKVDQRNAGTSVTTSSSGTWTLDRWHSENSASSKYTVQQSSDVPSGQGFSKSMVITSSSAYSVGASEVFLMRQHIEGLNFGDFAWGTLNAKTATLSFWVKSSLTGTFSGAARNNDNNRSYIYQYTINQSNTWEYKTITIPGDTTGTWYTDTNRGVTIMFTLASGSTQNPYSYTGSWISGNYQAIPNQVNLLGTNGATMYITGVQFEKGSSATSFDFRPYQTELRMCQRYYQQLYGFNDAGTTYLRDTVYFKESMRAAPTVYVYATGWQGGPGTVGTGTVNKIYQGSGETAAGASYSSTETCRVAASGFTSNIDIYYLLTALSEL